MHHVIKQPRVSDSFLSEAFIARNSPLQEAVVAEFIMALYRAWKVRSSQMLEVLSRASFNLILTEFPGVAECGS